MKLDRLARSILGRSYGRAAAYWVRTSRKVSRLLIPVQSLLIPLLVHRVKGRFPRDHQPDELVVATVVRNGEPWVEAFVEHYRKLGASRMVFVENDSTDRTLAILRELGDDVIVYRTSLFFRRWQFAIRRWLVRRVAGNSWVLLADIDEFFDYPRSSAVPLRSFLRYLEDSDYSAGTVHMLDLFTRESPFDAADDGDFRKTNRLYDVSALIWRPFERQPAMRHLHVTVGDPRVHLAHDGIMKAAFGFHLPLSKLALIRSGKGARVINAHWSDNVRTADLSCVFYHYRFVNGFLERTRVAARARRYFGGSMVHRWILDRVEEHPEIRLARSSARQLKGVDQLLSEGVLYASPRYLAWAESRPRMEDIGPTPEAGSAPRTPPSATGIATRE